VQEKLDHQEAWILMRVWNGMDALRCPPPETPVKIWSGGERVVWRYAVALQKPDILS